MLVFSRNPKLRILQSSDPVFKDTGYYNRGFEIHYKPIPALELSRLARKSIEAGQTDVEAAHRLNRGIFCQYVVGWSGFSMETAEGVEVEMPCTTENKALVADHSQQLVLSVVRHLFSGEGDGVEKKTAQTANHGDPAEQGDELGN